MVIYNAKLNGTLCSIEIADGRIATIGANRSDGDIDARGKRVIAGFIDIHTHGCGGYDTMDGCFAPLCKKYARCGTTSFLPTTMTMDNNALLRATNSSTSHSGASIIGFHLEGPYISVRYKGAQNEAFIRKPDYDEFCCYKNVKMVTLAPELEGAYEFISKATKNGCLVALGHSQASFDEASKAFSFGANGVTHLYNAMPPFHHRDTGIIGAAFMHRAYAQIICDGLHVSKAAFLTAYKMLGADRLTLISDSLCCAGMPDGEYISGGLKVILKNRRARLTDGTLAGSSAMLINCVRKAIEFGVPFEDAVKMASETPARLLGVNKGVVAEGYDADLLIVDDNLELDTVIINGEVFST